jgi:hypothetical protein
MRDMRHPHQLLLLLPLLLQPGQLPWVWVDHQVMAAVAPHPTSWQPSAQHKG